MSEPMWNRSHADAVVVPSPRAAFTLVELLVVITIITILLALLIPAMDRAIYEAQLVVCASQLKAGATATVVYAIDHKRFYPNREGVREAGYDLWYPSMLRNGSTSALVTNAINPDVDDPTRPTVDSETAGVWDDRPVLRTYLDINAMLNDPLNVGKLDFDGSDSDSHIYAGYELWLGYQFQSVRSNRVVGHTQRGRGGKGMFRVGDRLEYAGKSYSVLLSDRDLERRGGSEDNAQSNHMDYDHSMVEILLQDGNHPNAQAGPVAKLTYGTWWHPQAGLRGPVDLNFAYENGSVQVHRAVRPHIRGDARMDYVPTTQLTSGHYCPLPKE